MNKFQEISLKLTAELEKLLNKNEKNFTFQEINKYGQLMQDISNQLDQWNNQIKHLYNKK